MRTIKECWENTEDYSKLASDASRQLAFAGIAAIWVVNGSKHPVQAELMWPMALLAIALLLDILHYLIGTSSWWVFTKYHEEKLIESGEERKLVPESFIEVPSTLNWAPNTLFFAKHAALLFGWLLITIEFVTLAFCA
jgi:hypothetical protein